MEQTKEFRCHQLEMRSARSEAEERKYRKVDCKRGTWLISQQSNSADNLYFENPHNRKGFGGAKIRFPLEDGSVYEAIGPWKTGADGLFVDTGIDVRNTYSTFVVIGRGVRFEPGRYMPARIITDVLHQDSEWQISRYDRWRDILNALPAGEYQTYCATLDGYSVGREISDGSLCKVTTGTDDRTAL